MSNFTAFREMEHTADLALQIFGRNIEELFYNAYLGFYHLVFSKPEIINEFSNFSNHGQKIKILRFEDNNLEDLLHSFLSELNYYLQSKKKIFYPLHQLTFHQSSGQFELKIECGEAKLPDRYLNEVTEIKAVTYHGLKIMNENGIWTATVIFDI